jgi:hypothetical protein
MSIIDSDNVAIIYRDSASQSYLSRINFSKQTLTYHQLFMYSVAPNFIHMKSQLDFIFVNNS